MAVTVELFTSSGTWTCPAGVTEVLVECWGSGGTGGGVTGYNSAAGGGAGGGYARKVFTVTPGTGYPIGVAAKRPGSATAQRSGYTSTFNSVTEIKASGGNGGYPVSYDSGFSSGGVGMVTTSIGDTTYNGGNGSNGVNNVTSGGGGSAAGSSGPGNSASGMTGGAAKSDYGGKGGDGKYMASSAGIGGGFYGGGGGGAVTYGSTTDRVGGFGEAGLVRLTYGEAPKGFILQQL